MADTRKTDRLVAVSFPLEQKDGWPPVANEEIQGVEVGENLFRLRGIPFYARAVARDDVVKAAPKNGRLEFIEVVDRAEAATVRAIVFDPSMVAEVRKGLSFLGCDTAINELGKLVAIHVPSFMPYGPVRDYLESQAKTGTLGYEASCLMHTI
jgi:hypothetical protein